MARAEGIVRLLLVDDSLTEADGIINILRSAGHAVRAIREDNLGKVEQLLMTQNWDLLLCRDTIPALPPSDILALIQRLGKDLPCIVLVNNRDDEASYFHNNAQDVVLYGDEQRLQFVVNRELKSLFSRRLGRRNERALRESEKRSRALLESSRDAVAYMHEGMHIYVNHAYLDLFGYEEAEDIDGLPILDLVAPEDHNKFKSVFRQFAEHLDAEPVVLTAGCVRSDGTPFTASIEFSHACIEGEDCTQVVVRDDASVNGNDAKLKLLRDHDLLTGLYTRTRFMDALEKASFNAAEGRGDSELFYLVLDGFQAIKEQVGLITSDQVIKSIAELLRKNMEEGEILARYGDQVFTVLIPHQDDQQVDQRAQSYLQAVDNFSSYHNGKMIDMHCSIGISRISESESSTLLVLEHADKACTQARYAGGNRIVHYVPTQTGGQLHALTEEEWQQKLNAALDSNGFMMQFQPIVSLHGEAQELYEVLLRLKDTNGNTIVAETFIGHATKLNLMPDIDRWVIRNALEKLVDHRHQFPKTRFFIKLSEQTLDVPDFVDWLSATLDAHGLSGDAVIFEISETTALANMDSIISVIAKLKAIGCEFGLEHFGSGIDFSNSLSMLDVEYLKINGAFVENMAHDAENQAAVKAIIEMTKAANKNCIAEFVSDANSLAMLWRLGVDYAQGFYIHKPSDELDYDFDEHEL